MLISVGIDPGLTGAVVGLTSERKLWRYFDQPVLQETKTRKSLDIKATWDELEAWTIAARAEGYDIRAVLEQCTPRPMQGLQAIVAMSRSVTLWEVTLTGLSIPYRVVMPAHWTRSALKGMRGEGKDRAIRRCNNEIPELPTKTERGRKITGRSDAACLALYGLEMVWK